MQEQKNCATTHRLQPQQQARAKTELQQKMDRFKKGFSACREAKNFVMK
jgi:hypothetical protein